MRRAVQRRGHRKQRVWRRRARCWPRPARSSRAKQPPKVSDQDDVVVVRLRTKSAVGEENIVATNAPAKIDTARSSMPLPERRALGDGKRISQVETLSSQSSARAMRGEHFRAFSASTIALDSLASSRFDCYDAHVSVKVSPCSWRVAHACMFVSVCRYNERRGQFRAGVGTAGHASRAATETELDRGQPRLLRVQVSLPQSCRAA